MSVAHAASLSSKSFKTKKHLPYWSLGKIPKGTLTLANGNLNCAPYDCTIELKQNQSFRPYKNSKHIFELVTPNQGKTEIVSYYYYSNDVVNIPAYSGDPIGILVAFDPKGVVQFVRVIEMNEPILIEGIPLEDLVDAANEYVGKNIRDNIVVGKKQKGFVTIDMITGATVTSLVLNQTILASSRLVGQQVGVLKASGVSEYLLSKKFKTKTWSQLLKMGAIGHILIKPQEMGLPASNQPWLEVYFADLTQPTIGRNILGDSTYQSVMSALKPKQSALMLAGGGTWQGGFKGSAFVRGAIYDRFHITQGLNTFTFRDVDYQPLYSIVADGVPYLAQRGIFTVTSSAYSPTQPFDLVIVANRLTGVTAVSKMYKSFVFKYQMPKSLMIKNPAYHAMQTSEKSLLARIWEGGTIEIIAYLLLWLIVLAAFLWRKQLAQHSFWLESLRIFVFLVAFAFVGVYLEGQISVVNIFTFANVLIDQKSFRVFLLNPYIAITWVLTMITVFIWGRSFYCGWLCPFGALQELIYKVRKWIYPIKKRPDFNKKARPYLRSIRYIIFLLLFIVSLASLRMAEIFAEIEPFKTTWNVGILHRSFGYGAYVVLLLILGGFVHRFFCRYLCPLGAGLSILSRFQLIKLPRRNACSHCKICQHDCEPAAIEDGGHINNKECTGCLICLKNLHDKKVCPPLRSKKIWIKYDEKEI